MAYLYNKILFDYKPKSNFYVVISNDWQDYVCENIYIQMYITYFATYPPIYRYTVNW